MKIEKFRNWTPGEDVIEYLKEAINFLRYLNKNQLSQISTKKGKGLTPQSRNAQLNQGVMKNFNFLYHIGRINYQTKLYQIVIHIHQENLKSKKSTLSGNY